MNPEEFFMKTGRFIVDALRDAGYDFIHWNPVYEIKEIKEAMEKNGVIKAMMSGSGPSVFGIFENIADAESAEADIKALGYFAKALF